MIVGNENLVTVIELPLSAFCRPTEISCVIFVSQNVPQRGSRPALIQDVILGHSANDRMEETTRGVFVESKLHVVDFIGAAKCEFAVGSHDGSTRNGATSPLTTTRFGSREMFFDRSCRNWFFPSYLIVYIILPVKSCQSIASSLTVTNSTSAFISGWI